MKRLVVFSLGAMVLVGVAFFFSQPPTVVVSPSSDGEAYPESSSYQTSTASIAEIELQELQTFKGAVVDGALRTDHRGNLVIDMQLRHWIDFHLTAMGEISLAEIKLVMQQQMRELPQPGQQQALDLLDAYMGYLAALDDYEFEEVRRLVEPQASDVEARFRWQQRLRREWLEPLVVEAFFAGEESIDEYTLAAQRLRKDGASAEELAALETTLPEPIREMRAQSRQVISMGENESSMKEQGASTEEIQQWRIQEYGVEAAERLAKMDKRQSQWQQRLRGYQRYQQELTEKNLPTSEQDKLLKNYQSRHFDQSERKRLNAAISLLE